MRPFALNIKGRLHQYMQPTVMGIINVTPDSFFPGSRANGEEQVKEKVKQMVRAGADFIDLGAYSTRPGCSEVSEDEELRRLDAGMKALREANAHIPVSIDTFRAGVARRAISEMGADIVNDISGGALDHKMAETVAELKCPYVLMHMRGTPASMHHFTDYENLLADVIKEMMQKYVELNQLGVCDIIVDPGFGFSKTLEQNYILLKHLGLFDILKCPLLVGLSRKSMLTKLLNIEPEKSLEATTALNMFALQHGASILRVHDVEPAVQAVKIYNQLS